MATQISRRSSKKTGKLEGKIAVVTGASKGIKLAITQALIAAGAHVIAGARASSDELDALVRGGAVEQCEGGFWRVVQTACAATASSR